MKGRLSVRITKRLTAVLFLVAAMSGPVAPAAMAANPVPSILGGPAGGTSFSFPDVLLVPAPTQLVPYPNLALPSLDIL
ncbi:hypothetical protein [Sinosporangium siamense]|uniref:Uncharacterized protein n=1 Tax=Sinosporangium siamense TaxID=1367973 RepID=A0A919VGR5_9ACTN|nr:hypothetical protein [Sinosporangium siamense]GII97369.1 hypothetical protein Ssi02_76000 [Sinosporangium siamense]